jgi:TM2 domain-containing membrane protein YozV
MPKPKKKPWLAGLLSFLVMGMGQVYNKQYKKGVLLYIVGVFFSILALINYWLYFVLIPIWLYAIYDAYKTAKKTITEEPYKNAVWITALIFIVVFMGAFWAGFWAGFYGVQYGNYTIITTEKQAEVKRYEEIRQKLLREMEEFDNKHNEAWLSFKAGDAVTARSKISEAKSILIDLKNDYEFFCSFRENNLELFPNVTVSDTKKCKALVEMYKTCFPKWVDSFYSLTYLLEQSEQIKTQEDIENYRKTCYSWLNDYNVVRGSCNTIIEINKLDVKPFEDFSNMCNV